jgi:hypothetical protein
MQNLLRHACITCTYTSRGCNVLCNHLLLDFKIHNPFPLFIFPFPYFIIFLPSPSFKRRSKLSPRSLSPLWKNPIYLHCDRPYLSLSLFTVSWDIYILHAHILVTHVVHTWLLDFKMHNLFFFFFSPLLISFFIFLLSPYRVPRSLAH